MKSATVAVVVALLCFPIVGQAQNCCAPAVSPQGVLGETVALPHTLDIGVHYEYLRSRDMYEGSDRIANPRNTEADWKRAILTVAYGLFPQLSVSAVIPYAWKKKRLDLVGDNSRIELASDGIGDVSILLRFSPLTRSFVNFRELSLGLGVKAPTGSADWCSWLPEELQPGTGSWDFIGSVSYYQGFEPVDFVLSSTYVLTTAHHDQCTAYDESYEFGDQLSYLLTANCHPAARFDLSLAISGIVRGRDILDDEKVPGTGRHQLWFVPGLQFVAVPETLRLQVFFEQPIYQHFNGEQLGSDFNVRLTVVYTLPLKKSTEDDT
ncbi:MAG TPA: transporter [Acidobacteriota bacterium]|nr:transporter [Acidobacteriota bacterium]